MISDMQTPWSDIIVYCIIPIAVFYSSRILDIAYKRAIGCYDGSRNCQLFSSLIGQRLIVLSIIIGGVNLYRVFYQGFPPEEMFFRPFGLTVPFVVTFANLLFGSMCYGIFHVIRIDIENDTSKQTEPILVGITNVTGITLLLLSVYVLIGFITTIRGVN